MFPSLIATIWRTQEVQLKEKNSSASFPRPLTLLVTLFVKTGIKKKQNQQQQPATSKCTCCQTVVGFVPCWFSKPPSVSKGRVNVLNRGSSRSGRSSKVERESGCLHGWKQVLQNADAAVGTIFFFKLGSTLQPPFFADSSSSSESLILNLLNPPTPPPPPLPTAPRWISQSAPLKL